VSTPSATPVPATTTHRPTRRLGAALAAAVGLGYLTLVTGSSWLVVLTAATAAVLLGSLAARAVLDGLEVEVLHAPRVTVGDELRTTVTVVNAGHRASSPTQLCLHTKGLTDVVVSVGALGPGERTSTVVDRPATARAAAYGSVGHLVSRPAFGLLAGMRELRLRDQVLVHPAVRHHVERTVAQGVQHGDEVVAGRGPETLGVREWRSGDDAARVHWRTTARSGRPALLVRGDTVAEQLRLVLVGADHDRGFEDAVRVAASICDTALRNGSGVAAVAWHLSGPVLAAAGSATELLDWWSTVHETVLPDPADLGRTVQAGLGPGEVLLVATPDTDDGWLAAAAAHCPDVRLRRVVVGA
jgi:uncharacterized protein (DUF58 family)